MEFNPYLVVEEYGVNIQPNSEFTVLILCTLLIFLKYESVFFLYDQKQITHFEG